MSSTRTNGVSSRVALVVALAGFAAGLAFFSALQWEVSGRPAHALPGLTLQEDALAAAMDYRRNNGLRDEEEFVRQVEADTGSRREFGLALTEEEFTEIAARQERIVAAADRLNEAFERDPGFAGVYVDQRAGFVMRVSTSSVPAALDETVESFAAEGIRISVSRAEWALDELSQLRDEIAASIPTWAENGIASAQ